MLKAGALLYSVFVTLIVALLTMSILWGHYFGANQMLHSVKRTQLQNNIRSAINKMVVFPDSLPYNQNIETFPFVDDLSVQLTKTRWGMYDLIKGETVFKNDTLRQMAFVGQSVFDADSTALYVSDRGREVFISGNIQIEGRCQVPQGIFKYAYINSQQESVISQSFPAVLHKSTPDLPEINEETFTHNDDLLWGVGLEGFLRIARLAEYLSGKDSVCVSFYEPTLVLQPEAASALRDVYLSGNIMIVSMQPIEIEATAKLDKVLIYAPSIELHDSVAGNMQLFASDSIVVGKHCRLNYPSCLVALSVNISAIRIAENSKISGNVFQYQEPLGELDIHSLISFETGTEMQGVVFGNGYVQPQGKQNGSLYAGQLYLKTNAGHYENHLMNAEIDFGKLPKTYISGNIFKRKKQRILQWYY